MLKQTTLLIKKEFLLEFRQKTAISSIVLYVISSLFVCTLIFKHIADPLMWNALLWVLIIFNSVTTTSKSFANEGKGRGILNYSLYSPKSFILAKIIYNVLLLCFVSVLTFVFYSFFIGNKIQSALQFLTLVLLTSAALSSILTLVAGISSRANGSFALTSILSFPVTFPLIILTVKLSQFIVDGIAFSVCIKYFLAILALNVIVFLLAYLLFPYLWKD